MEGEKYVLKDGNGQRIEQKKEENHWEKERH